jgi:GNAT superfamily N-acetyltransferase
MSTPSTPRSTQPQPSTPTTPTMETLRVREATRGDLPAIVALVAADAIREVVEDIDETGMPAPAYVKAFEEIDADTNTLLLVGELAGEVVATCQLNFLRQLVYHGGLVAQVESVRTVSHRRGEGIGTALLDWVIAESRRRGAVRLQLTSNVRRVDARRFYERLGFRATHVGMKLYLGNGDGDGEGADPRHDSSAAGDGTAGGAGAADGPG